MRQSTRATATKRSIDGLINLIVGCFDYLATVED
jgi:hypothetical protein